MSEYIFIQHNLRVVDLNHLFQSEIELNIINDLYSYQLLNKGRMTKDIRKVIYHHILIGMYHQIQKFTGTEKTIFIISESTNLVPELDNYLTGSNQVAVTILKQITNQYPVKILKTSVTFSQLIDCINCKTGEGIEILRKLTDIISVDNSMYTFSKNIRFTEINQLNAINKIVKSTNRQCLVYK